LKIYKLSDRVISKFQI